MAEMLGVSRETWRKALGLLRGEGVLYSRHGSGTYLQEPSHRITNDLSQLKSMSKMIAEAGLREQGSCMTCTVGTAPEEVCRFFEAPETAEFAIIQHIRRTEKDVIAVSLGYLPEKYAEKMHGAIPQSLFAFLEESEGIYISRASTELFIPTMKTLDPKKAENKAEKAVVNGSAEDATVSAPSVQINLSKVKIEPLFADDVDFETFSKSDFRVVKIEACEAVPKSKKLLKFTLNDGTDRKRTILSGIHEYYEPEELVGKTCVAITNLPPRKMMGIDSEGMLISAVYEYDGREGLNLLMLDDSIPAGAKLY